MGLELDTVVLGEWILKKKLGAGAAGIVYLAVSIRNGKTEAAIKTGKIGHSNIALEHEVYEALNAGGGANGIPSIHQFGQQDGYHCLVISILGQSLHEIFKANNRAFSSPTILKVALQLLDRIEFLHSKGFIHRDIKTDNIMIGGSSEGLKTIYLVDYNLSKKYTDESGYHIPMDQVKGFRGTCTFASQNAHLGRELSRRDDLESLGYTLLYLCKGNLPWIGAAKGNKRRHAIVCDMKRWAMDSEDFWKGIPSVLHCFMSRVGRLQFDQEPEYEKYRECFKRALRRWEAKNGGPGDLDWVKPLRKNESNEN